MLVTSYVVREGSEFGELHGIAGACFLAKTVPRGHAIKLNLSRCRSGFQKNEGIAYPLQKIRARHFAQLGLRIVQVVDVDALDAEIAQATLQLIFQESRRHAVAAAYKVVRAEYSGLDVFAIEIFRRIGRHCAIGSQIPALGAENKFFARDSLFGQILDGGADAALASLKAVVDGRIDNVDAALDRRRNRRGVALISLVVGLAEIGADSQRGKHQAVRFAKMAVRGSTRESFCILRGSVRRCGYD